MRRTLTVLVVTLLAVAGAACDNGPSQSATDFKSPPYERGIEVGRTYNYSLLTHCGINQTRIDGTNWRASPPLDDGSGNPPSGWDNPSTTGDLRIVSKDKAIFTVGDLSATFVRANLPASRCA
jgi:hypothetical protein